MQNASGAGYRCVGGRIPKRWRSIARIADTSPRRTFCPAGFHRTVAGIRGRPDAAVAFGRNARLTALEVRDALAALATVAEQVVIHFLWRPVLADAEDELVLDLAMNGRADMLVTFNQVDFAEASKTFQIEIVTPAAALRRLRK